MCGILYALHPAHTYWFLSCMSVSAVICYFAIFGYGSACMYVIDHPVLFHPLPPPYAPVWYGMTGLQYQVSSRLYANTTKTNRKGFALFEMK